jgi:hypothetical protein
MMKTVGVKVRLVLSFILVTFIAVSKATTTPFDASLLRCPLPCEVTGLNSSNWTYYHDEDSLFKCNETTLLELNVCDSLSDPKSYVSLRACTVSAVAADPSVPKRQVLSLNSTTTNETS